MYAEPMAALRVDQQQLREFDRSLGQAARNICPRFGIDPEECIADAAAATCYGKFAIHNNYFNLPGDGDRGHNLVIRSEPTGSVEGGGRRPISAAIGKFSSPSAAVLAYCMRRRQLSP